MRLTKNTVRLALLSLALASTPFLTDSPTSAQLTTPLNNATSSLGTAHQNGSGTLVLKDGEGARFGTPSVDHPIRVTVAARSTLVNGQIAPTSTQTIFLCTSRTGDTLSGLTATEGTVDQNFTRNDPVAALVTAGMIAEIQQAATGAGADITDLTATVNTVVADVATKANDSAVVKLAGDQAITGLKSFTDRLTAPVADSGGQLYNCKTFGARGGGVTDDTAAIQAAVDAAGPGGTVLLPRDTYLVSGPITLPARAVLRGDRSTIKRANQIVTTTNSAVSIGSNTITVSALNGLRVGHYVTVATGVPLPATGGRVASAGTGYVTGETVTLTGGLAPGGVAATATITASGGAITGIVIATQGSGYVSSPKVTINTVAGVGGVVIPPWPDPVYDPADHKILSVNGNTLTVQGNFTVGFNSGAAVYTAWNGINSSGGGTRIYDLIMDGNRSNWSFYPWACVAEMSLQGDRYMVQGCELYESPGEGIIVFGNYNSCLTSWIHDINGNGVHFSGVMNVTILDVAVVHGNQDQSVGHGYRAGIAWSAEISHVTCIGNYVEDCLNGFGAIKDTLNSDVTLMGNTIVNCWENGISLKCGTIDRAPKNVVIVGNRIYRCPIGVIVSHTQPGSALLPSQVSISSNLFEDNPIGVSLGNTRYVSVVDNLFKGATGAATGVTFHVSFSNSKHLNISNNTFSGLRYGVYGGDSVTENLRISGNIFTNQYSQSVVIAGAKNCVVTDNILSNDATAISGYIGILAYGSVGITGNKLNLDNTNGGVVGIYLNTSMATYTAGPNVQGNEIRGTSSYGIRTGEGQAVVASNVYTATTPMRNDTGIVTTPAVLTFTRSSGVITGVTVVSGGSYSVKPSVYAIDATGTGATFSVTMSGNAIASVAVVTGGANYANPTASIGGNFVGTNFQVN